MLWLLNSLEFAKSNWKFFLGLVLGIWLASTIHRVTSFFQEKVFEANLAAQVELDKSICRENMKITNEVSNAYTKSLTAVSRQLAELKRMFPSGQLVLTAPSPSPGDGAAKGKSTLKNEVSSDDLWNYAGNSEELRQQLLACQQFIHSTWKEKGQFDGKSSQD